MKRIRVEVISQNGHCLNGLKKGDIFYISAKGIEGKVCIHALYSMLPKAFAMLYGAKFPWEEECLDEQGSNPLPISGCPITHVCHYLQKTFNPVTFELEVDE